MRNPFATRLLPFFLWALCFALPAARAAEVIPPAPKDHFNDYAGVVRPDTARELNQQLTQFERDTSNQLVVAIFPRMQSSSSIEDYTFRVKEAWGVGQKGRNNGAVLFIFSEDRKLFFQVGYGLEPVLTDALSKRIIEEEITPRFRQGDFEGGVRAGTAAFMAAARGEYRGTGRTAADRGRRVAFGGGGGFMFLILAMIILGVFRRLFRRNTLYTRRGRMSPWISSGGGWGGGGGGWGG
ncbi:MAG: TPM domain-containing protein, partial [Opitutaceae bacterium]